ncbi:hypothetical protein QVD17_41870 [Tagetes erecta]|uniref:Uncharacterized protein n=1 Tax=Tagetes erecta TaxID=13708 RepID=A0AAD8JPU3_TARER|nr:hypothetical protein QVD17_41870 [Tagetes erecta]
MVMIGKVAGNQNHSYASGSRFSTISKTQNLIYSATHHRKCLLQQLHSPSLGSFLPLPNPTSPPPPQTTTLSPSPEFTLTQILQNHRHHPSSVSDKFTGELK